ncbi:SBBP repeat-containing protein, partial [Myxococcota bacterium]|nr:SBBP repeat-containing protein [Myxococcota bacterium]
FIARLDTSGAFLWAVNAGGDMQNRGISIATDSAGNSYVTGNFQGTANFGPHNLVSVGGEDVFVSKVDPTGDFLWATQGGGGSGDTGYGITLDSIGNIFVTGNFIGTASFGTAVLTSPGGYDAMVLKIDNDGNWLGAARAGGVNDCYGYSVAVDGNDNVYTVGNFLGTADFGGTILTSAASWEVFLAKNLLQ